MTTSAPKALTLLLCTLIIAAVTAYNSRGTHAVTASSKEQRQEGSSGSSSRRGFLATAAATFVTSASVAFLPPPSPAEAASLSDLTDVYFGVGCFWHIQHEFVEAESKLLGRGDKELTSLTGYAGGKSTDKEGRVCYHNFQSIADYGKLGHGEVVGMKIPEDSIADFAKEYFNLFTPKGGEHLHCVSVCYLFLFHLCSMIIHHMQRKASYMLLGIDKIAFNLVSIPIVIYKYKYREGGSHG